MEAKKNDFKFRTFVLFRVFSCSLHLPNIHSKRRELIKRLTIDTCSLFLKIFEPSFAINCTYINRLIIAVKLQLAQRLFLRFDDLEINHICSTMLAVAYLTIAVLLLLPFHFYNISSCLLDPTSAFNKQHALFAFATTIK